MPDSDSPICDEVAPPHIINTIAVKGKDGWYYRECLRCGEKVPVALKTQEALEAME